MYIISIVRLFKPHVLYDLHIKPIPSPTVQGQPTWHGGDVAAFGQSPALPKGWLKPYR